MSASDTVPVSADVAVIVYRTKAEKLERMVQRLGSATSAYLSDLANGVQPTEEQHYALALLAYDYAHHTDAMILTEPTPDPVEF